MGIKTNMAEALIFGSPEPNVQYTERRAAYVVIVNDDRLVATVKSRQKHFLPGGGSLPGEAPEDTIAREVREELARGVRLARKIGKATQYFYSGADERHYVMRATFLIVGRVGRPSCSTMPLYLTVWTPKASRIEPATTCIFALSCVEKATSITKKLIIRPIRSAKVTNQPWPPA